MANVCLRDAKSAGKDRAISPVCSHGLLQCSAQAAMLQLARREPARRLAHASSSHFSAYSCRPAPRGSRPRPPPSGPVRTAHRPFGLPPRRAARVRGRPVHQDPLLAAWPGYRAWSPRSISWSSVSPAWSSATPALNERSGWVSRARPASP